ncbi:MAG: hypothetical protein HFJ33_05435 [Clostridia bacterium]|nr:hypothetical protein [Clostridia bacterium]
MEDTYANAYVEILEILKYVPVNEIAKIPKKEIEFFERNKNVNYQYDYNVDNPVTLRKTDAIIVNLFKKYFSNEEENKKIDELLFLNEQKSELKKGRLYSNKVIFERQIDESIQSNLPVEVKEENFIQKIISKLKIFIKMLKSRKENK